MGYVPSILSWFFYTVAAAVGIILGGPVYDVTGCSLKKVWIGPDGASAKVESYHLKRGLFMSLVAHLLYVLGMLFAYIHGIKLIS